MHIEFTATNTETYKVKEMSAEELIYNYEGFIKKIIFYFDKEKKYFDDLYQAAVVELLRCKENFDPARGIYFCYYCKPFIISKIKQEYVFNSIPLSMSYRTAYTRKSLMAFEDITDLEYKLAGEDQSEHIMLNEETEYMIKVLEEKIRAADITEKQRKSLEDIVKGIKGKKHTRGFINRIKPENLELLKALVRT